MTPEENESRPQLCPNCQTPMIPQEVRTAIWQGDQVAIVEDIPALVCGQCREQYYDDDVSDALRKLNEEGFPESEAEGTIEVPVFSLEGRVRKRTQAEEDVYVD